MDGRNRSLDTRGSWIWDWIRGGCVGGGNRGVMPEGAGLKVASEGAPCLGSLLACPRKGLSGLVGGAVAPGGGYAG